MDRLCKSTDTIFSGLPLESGVKTSAYKAFLTMVRNGQKMNKMLGTYVKCLAASSTMSESPNKENKNQISIGGENVYIPTCRRYHKS